MNNDLTKKIDYETNRIALFAHFDKNNIIHDYVIYYLRRLKETAKCIVFVSTSDLQETEIAKIKNLCFKIITRKNIGYDFMSWKIALTSVDLSNYDELIICNDSVYGPLFSLKEVFKTMEDRECDFWGITGSHQWAYHVQSYFVVFKKSVFSSPVFSKFFEGIADRKNKLDIISQYEVGLSQKLIKNGFKADTYVQYVPSFWKQLKYLTLSRFIKYLKWMFPTPQKELFTNLSINLTHFYWREIISQNRMPFVKVELLRDNPKKVNIANYDLFIKKHSDYDLTYISRHLHRGINNDTSRLETRP
jgi:lipopolysaccharide biosynthesis protein